MERGDEKATERLSFRATARQKDAIERLALAERRNVSEWIRLRIEVAIEGEEPRPAEGPRGARR